MINKELVYKIAHEAHIMGRVYNQLGEPRKPGEEWNAVEKMVDRFLQNNEDCPDIFVRSDNPELIEGLKEAFQNTSSAEPVIVHSGVIIKEEDNYRCEVYEAELRGFSAAILDRLDKLEKAVSEIKAQLIF